MTPFRPTRRSILIGLLGLMFAMPAVANGGYDRLAVQGAVNHVLYHVIYRAADTARADAYASRTQALGAPRAADAARLGHEARLELKYIDAAHRDAVDDLETRFYRKLTRFARAFERQATRAHTTDHVWDLRDDLEPKVARAHATYRRALAEEDRRYCDLRARILGTN